MSNFACGVLTGILSFWLVISIAIIVLDAKGTITLDNTFAGIILTAPATIPAILFMGIFALVKKFANALQKLWQIPY